MRHYSEALAGRPLRYRSGRAAFGLVLAALGVYGVMAFSVAQRTTEIGIRMALGARPGDILPLVVRRGVILIGAGLCIGTVAAIWLNRLMTGVLTEVGRVDPAVLGCAGCLIAAAALGACVMPALRATRLDPLVALKRD